MYLFWIMPYVNLKVTFLKIQVNIIVFPKSHLLTYRLISAFILLGIFVSVFTSLPSLCVPMVCVCMFVCGKRCAHTEMSMFMGSRDWHGLPSSVSLYLLRKSLSLNLELTRLADLVDQQAPGILWSPAPSPWILVTQLHLLCGNGLEGFKRRSSCCREHFTDRAISSAYFCLLELEFWSSHYPGVHLENFFLLSSSYLWWLISIWLDSGTFGIRIISGGVSREV